MVQENQYSQGTIGSSAAAVVVTMMGMADALPDSTDERHYVAAEPAYVFDISTSSTLIADVKKWDDTQTRQVLKSFAEHFSKKLVDTPPDFAKAINDNFMKLL